MGNPIAQSLTYEARLELAHQTIIEAGVKVPVLVDEIDNPVWCTYGPAPNSAYLIGIEGSIILKQSWYDPTQVEKVLINYLNHGGS